MAAVLGLEDEDVTKLCRWAEKESGQAPLSPANFNSPGQVVISGKMSAIEWLKSNYSPEASGIGKKLKMIVLNVSAPFHSQLMKPAQDQMSVVLNKLNFESPKFPIIQNTTARETSNGSTIRTELISQISAPVKWAQSVTRMRELGVTSIIEFGPGKVLAGLIKKTDAEFAQTYNLQSMDEFKLLVEKVKT
jgi:[acyl-carrier-protein] S-malonyltransferase